MIRAMFGSRSPSVPPRRSALARRGSRLPAALVILLAAPVSAQTPATLPETMTLDNVRSFLAANDVGTVEAFVAALPPLHKRHFVAVHKSFGPEKKFISGTHPRIVSWGSDSRFIASWTTHPQSPTREHVEFLQAVPSAGKWLAGVIDFSADPVEITQPASCAGCHTSMNRPLWGGNIPRSDVNWRFSGAEGDGSPGSKLVMSTMRASEDPRITALSLNWAAGNWIRRIPGVGGFLNFPLWDFARTLSMRHGEVVYGHLMLRPDADRARARIICSVAGPRPGHFSDSPALWDPRLFPDGTTAVQGWGASNMGGVNRYYNGGKGRLTDAVWFLALHDAYQRSPAVQALYKSVTNIDSIRFDNVTWTLGLHHPAGDATAAQELLANHKEFFGTSGQAHLDQRLRRIHGKRGRASEFPYNESILQQHGERFAWRVCNVLKPSAPSALSATVGVVDGGSGVTLTWTDNSSDEHRFLVRFRKSGGAAWADGPSAVADETTATVAALAFSADYEFMVGAENRYGFAWSGTASVTTPAAPPPSGPRRLTVARTAALDGSHGARLIWSDPSFVVTGLEVESRETAADASWTVTKQVGADVRSTVLTGLDASKRHAFRVVAVDANRRIAGVETLPPPVPDVAGGPVNENEAFAVTPSLPGGGSDGLAWSLANGDAAAFGIDEDDGAVTMSAKDHEDPEDGDEDNLYDVAVTVTDGSGNAAARWIRVRVTNVNEAPTFEESAALEIEIPEGTTGTFGSPVTAADPDGDALTYSLAGADAASFAIGPASGQLSVTTGLGAGGRTSYGFDAVATDAGSPPLSARRAARVAVTPDPGGGEDPEATGSGAPGGGGGGTPATPTPPEPDPPTPPGTDPLAPSATPLTARFLPECSEGACRAVVGENVLFEDMSEGRATRRRWDFGDGANSARRVVSHAWSAPGFFTVTLEMTNGRDASSESRTFLVESASPRGTCEPDAFTRCLGHARFAVRVDWWTGDQGGTGSQGGRARVVEVGGDESSLFSFFGNGNWELLVKVLDGCAVNESFWVFGAAATDIGYRVAVTDTHASRVMEYENPPGSEARAVSDTNAFRAACEPN